MPKLTRSQLFMTASAKAQLQTACASLAQALTNIQIALPDDLDAKVRLLARTAYEAANEACDAVLARVDGELS